MRTANDSAGWKRGVVACTRAELLIANHPVDVDADPRAFTPRPCEARIHRLHSS